MRENTLKSVPNLRTTLVLIQILTLIVIETEIGKIHLSFIQLLLFFVQFPVIFHRNSLLITILLMVVTIILQGMLSFTVETPQWVQKINEFMEKNRVGQLFLTKHLVTAVWINQSHAFNNSFHWFNPFPCLCRVSLHHLMKMRMTLIWLNLNQLKRITPPPPTMPPRKNLTQAFGKRLQISSIEFYSCHCFSSTYSWSLIFCRRIFSPNHLNEPLKLLDINIFNDSTYKSEYYE